MDLRADRGLVLSERTLHLAVTNQTGGGWHAKAKGVPIDPVVEILPGCLPIEVEGPQGPDRTDTARQRAAGDAGEEDRYSELAL